MAKQIRTFSKTEYGHTFNYEAYTEDNGKTWKWTSNDACCPMDACEEFGIPCDKVAQQAALNEQLEAFAKEYHAAMKNHKYSDEEMFEMRSAFGEGTTVVNVLTGKRTKL